MKQTGMFNAFQGTIQFSPDKNLVALRDNNVDTGRTSFARLVAQPEHRGVWRREGRDGQPRFAVAHGLALLADGSLFLESGSASGGRVRREGKNGITSLGGDSGKVNLATGEYTKRLQENVFYHGLHASPDGTKIASVVHRAGSKPQLELLDAASGKTLQVVMEDPPASAQVPTFAFSADGQRLAARLAQRNFVFDLKDQQQLPLLDDKDHRQFYLVDQGKVLVYVYQDEVTGIDLENNTKAFSWQASRLQAGQMTCLDFSLDGRFAVCGSSLGELSVRNARTGEVLVQAKVFDKEIRGVGISADGTHVAAADYPRRLQVWAFREPAAGAGTFETIRIAP
jgi:WD40 repeat protein